ncbi:MAG TPA: peptide chain release factor 2 [Firmicutes bacterium]|nr:peptide chain release factor 2 [Bacillota bacterium]
MLADDLKVKIKELKTKFDGIEAASDIPALTAKYEQLRKEQEDPELYSDLKRAERINREAKNAGDKLEAVTKMKTDLTDLEGLLDMAAEENDEASLAEVASELEKLEEPLERLHIQTLLKGEYDSCNAILTLHSGAGGTEAQDWTSMLYRMYQMFCDKMGYSYEELDFLPGDEAGIKTVTFKVTGENAYGYLKAEKGVHRLVRISPFDSNARRHTSFASLEVMPEIENDTEIKIEDKDLRIDTYRSSGAGGQHINKTDSAVRITHIPTGIVTSCQTQRSQTQNKEYAMRMLMSKLVELRLQEQMAKAQDIKGELKKIEWGSQIRSYVFCPYTLVKDHRTGYETSNVQAVMDGNIFDFICDYLRKS